MPGKLYRQRIKTADRLIPTMRSVKPVVHNFVTEIRSVFVFSSFSRHAKSLYNFSIVEEYQIPLGTETRKISFWSSKTFLKKTTNIIIIIIIIKSYTKYIQYEK